MGGVHVGLRFISEDSAAAQRSDTEPGVGPAPSSCSGLPCSGEVTRGKMSRTQGLRTCIDFWESGRRGGAG